MTRILLILLSPVIVVAVELIQRLLIWLEWRLTLIAFGGK